MPLVTPSLILGLKEELVDLNSNSSIVETKVKTYIRLPEAALNTIQEVCNIPPLIWMQVSAWGKETGNLPAIWQSTATQLAEITALNEKPNLKQAKIGIQLLEEAERLGFNRFQEVG